MTMDATITFADASNTDKAAIMAVEDVPTDVDKRAFRKHFEGFGKMFLAKEIGCPPERVCIHNIEWHS